MRKIEDAKRLVKAYAKGLGLEEYDIYFVSKDREKEHSTETLENVEKCEYWIRKIEDAFKVNLKDGSRKRELVYIKYSLMYVLYNYIGINSKFAIAYAFELHHQVAYYGIKTCANFIECKDDLFLETYNQIKNYVLESIKEKYN